MALFKREQLHTEKGARKVRSLFREFSSEANRQDAIFCVNRYDRDGLKSLYKLYMEYVVDDPTEYTFAQEVFGDWSFWQNMRTKTPVKEVIEEWEAESSVARASKAIRGVIVATEDEKTSFQANKYILEKLFETKPSAIVDKRKARKDNKEHIEQAKEDEAFKADIARLNQYNFVN